LPPEPSAGARGDTVVNQVLQTVGNLEEMRLAGVIIKGEDQNSLPLDGLAHADSPNVLGSPSKDKFLKEALFVAYATRCMVVDANSKGISIEAHESSRL
jgi:hypothetical protein